MPEARRYWRINNMDINEINTVLNQIADRFDQLEGYRGTPTFLSAAVGKSADSSSEIPVFSQISSMQTALEDLYPPTYAEMFINTDKTLNLTAQNTFYQFIDFSSGHADNMTFDDFYDHIEVEKAGDYFIAYTISVGVTGTNQLCEFAIFNNGVELEDHRIERMFSTADVGSIASIGVDKFEVGDKITIRMQNTTSAGKVATIARCTVFLFRLHGE
jgi:hypothetical protein